MEVNLGAAGIIYIDYDHVNLEQEHNYVRAILNQGRLTQNEIKRVFGVIVPSTTVCIISRKIDDKTFGRIAQGVAICSFSDRFSRAKGRTLSLKRAIEHAAFTEADRATIWAEVNKSKLVKTVEMQVAKKEESTDGGSTDNH